MSRPDDRTMTRRRFGRQTGGALAALVCGAAGCEPSAEAQATPEAVREGRLIPRPRRDVMASLRSGPLGLGGSNRDGVVQMPSSLAPGPLPLLLLLHGATGTGARMLSRVAAAADQAGIVVVAPDSRGGTWDAIRDEFGDDVVFVNRVLAHVFERLAVDSTRLAIGGFSDGASYALSLGLANGDLFTRIVAFSPGFVNNVVLHGKPRVYVSHGTNDQILPIDVCSRQIVPRLRSRGYDVTFREFEGRHELPPDIQTEGFRWMTAS